MFGYIGAAQPHFPVQLQAPDMDRASNILGGLLSAVLVTKGELVSRLFVNGTRDANAARVSKILQPRCDIDPVAVNLLALDHHIAQG
jgi:hypothetical protein